jgi:hypothetical protein
MLDGTEVAVTIQYPRCTILIEELDSTLQSADAGSTA